MNTPADIEIKFNGESVEVPAGTSIASLLKIAEVRTGVVAVELNSEIVPREKHAETLVAAGDQIEAVTLVGGG